MGARLLSFGRAMSARANPAPGAMVVGGRYRLGKALGAGAMGVVYVATDERLGREVAIKVVRGTERGGKLDESALARFEREAMLTGKLGHPNIVTVTDLGRTEEGYPFVVMEKLEGRTLEARIREGQVPADEAVAIHVQLLDALACAHDAGVLHRDVKPANIFLSSLASGSVLVKLLDFGIAAPVSGGQKLTMDGSVIGSPVYLSPERFRGKPAQIESEIYAVGICLYETLVGSVPFEGLPHKPIHERVFNERPHPIDALRGDVSSQLARLVERALEKAPEARFHSAREMREALLALAPMRTSLAQAAEPSGRVRSSTVRGVSDPSAPQSALPTLVDLPPGAVPHVPPSSLPQSARVAGVPTARVERAPDTTVTRAPKAGMGRGAIIASVIIVLSSVAVGAFAGLRANQSTPEAPSVPAVAPAHVVAPPPVVTPPVVTPPAVGPELVIPEVPAVALPVGVDPPPAVEPPPPASPPHHAGTRPHTAPTGAVTPPRPAEVTPPPAETPPATPPPRAHMGADGLLHPNW